MPEPGVRTQISDLPRRQDVAAWQNKRFRSLNLWEQVVWLTAEFDTLQPVKEEEAPQEKAAK